MGYPCAKFGFIVRIDGHTESKNHTQADDHVTTVGVSKDD